MANPDSTRSPELAPHVAAALETFMSDLMDELAALHVARRTFEASLDVDGDETLASLRSVFHQIEARLNVLHERMDLLSVGRLKGAEPAGGEA